MVLFAALSSLHLPLWVFAQGKVVEVGEDYNSDQVFSDGCSFLDGGWGMDRSLSFFSFFLFHSFLIFFFLSVAPDFNQFLPIVSAPV